MLCFTYTTWLPLSLVEVDSLVRLADRVLVKPVVRRVRR